LKIGITVCDQLDAVVFAYPHHRESPRFDTKATLQALVIAWQKELF